MPSTITRGQIKTEFQDMLASTANIKASSEKQGRTIDRVLDRLQSYANWKDTIRKVVFEYIYDIDEYSVKNYLGISDFKGIYSLDGIAITDWRQFKKMLDNISPGKKDGEDYIKVDLQQGNAITIDQLSSIDNNGLWVATDDAVNLTERRNEFTAGSLEFDIDVSNSVENQARIYNETITAKDLTDYQDRSYFVLDIYLSNVTDLSSITLRWGSSNAKYWYLSATKPVDGESFVIGKNKVVFKWDNASSTGSPDVTAINYHSISFDYAAGYTDKSNFHISNLRLCERVQVDLEYFSSHMAKSSTGTWKAKPTDNTDILLVNDDMKPLILEWGFYELLRFSKKIDKQEIREARENVKELKEEALRNHGYSQRKGSRRTNIGR